MNHFQFTPILQFLLVTLFIIISELVRALLQLSGISNFICLLTGMHADEKTTNSRKKEIVTSS